MAYPLDSLASLARPDGGWGYVADQPAHLEPTCLALLALRPEAEQFRGQTLESFDRGINIDDIIPDFALSDGGAHRGGGSSHSVATEIDGPSHSCSDIGDDSLGSLSL